ncbi:transcriptional regulator [Candidatus Saccharibacteria bacterium]|nr:MAG: transcriptional regulator [Candidatus Saccharibacteria bacterium]
MNNLSSLEKRSGCVAAAMDIIGSKWTALILRDLAQDNCRFADLERSIPGLNPRTLSKRLEDLAEHHIIERCTGSPSYHLTQKGRDLIPVLEAMAAWGNKYSAPDSLTLI